MLPLLAVFTLQSVAQQPSPSWPASVLTNPFHVGDNRSQGMQHPEPDGKTFTARFDLPPNIKPGLATIVYVTIRVSDMLPMKGTKHEKQMKQGELLSLLFLNGTEVAILNKLVRGPESIANIETLHVRVPGNVFRVGSNDLEIRAGAEANNLDDFELHEVVIGSSPQ